MRRKPWVSVRDDLLWEPKPSVDIIEVELSDLGPRDLPGTWEEDGCSGTTVINNCQDGIVLVGLRETDDEVHGDLLERKGSWISRDFVHWWASAMRDDLLW